MAISYRHDQLTAHDRDQIPPSKWRGCIKKIWEVDPLECPNCKGDMKIINFINERPIIRKIFEHRHLWDNQQQQRPLPSRAGPRKSRCGKSSSHLLMHLTSMKSLIMAGPVLMNPISPMNDICGKLVGNLGNWGQTPFFLIRNKS